MSNPAQGRRSSRARPGRPGLQQSWRSRPLVHSLVARRLCSRSDLEPGSASGRAALATIPWSWSRLTGSLWAGPGQSLGRWPGYSHAIFRGPDMRCAAKDTMHRRSLYGNSSKKRPKRATKSLEMTVPSSSSQVLGDVIALKGTSARPTASTRGGYTGA